MRAEFPFSARAMASWGQFQSDPAGGVPAYITAADGLTEADLDARYGYMAESRAAPPVGDVWEAGLGRVGAGAGGDARKKRKAPQLPEIDGEREWEKAIDGGQDCINQLRCRECEAILTHLGKGDEIPPSRPGSNRLRAMRASIHTQRDLLSNPPAPSNLPPLRPQAAPGPSLADRARARARGR